MLMKEKLVVGIVDLRTEFPRNEKVSVERDESKVPLRRYDTAHEALVCRIRALERNS